MTSFYGILLLLLFVLIPVRSDWFTDQSPDTCTGPRVRRSWCTLSDQDKQNFVNLVYKLKTIVVQLANKPYTTPMPIYDMFVNTHSNSFNSNVWHGTTIFPTVHRHFIYKMESALRWVARVYGASLGIDDPCDIALPYWPWELDYENDTKDSYIPQDHSCIWDARYIGALPSPTSTVYDVTTGRFNKTSWVTTCSLNEMPNPSYYQSPTYGSLSNTLKRYCNSTVTKLSVSPTSIANGINVTAYANFEAWIEAGPHGLPHQWFCFHMQTMSSPDDPIFWLHHCNIDRLFALWQDCWDYELLTDPSSVYFAANPNNFQSVNPKTVSQAGPAKTDLQGNPFDVGVNAQMPYYYKASKGTTQGQTVYTYADSFIFPNATWPTPGQMFSTGSATSPGYEGQYYVYAGPDPEVTLMSTLTSKLCPLNTKWRIVNQSDKKRDVEGKNKNKNQKNDNGNQGIINQKNDNGHQERIMDVMKAKWDELKKLNNKNDEDTWKDLVMWDCENGAKTELTDSFVSWVKMNGLRPEQYDTVCDSVSTKWLKKFGSLSVDNLEHSGSALKTISAFLNLPETVVGVVIGVVVGVVVLAGVSIGIACYVRKSKLSTTDDEGYQKMRQPILD